jgi:hypothetical protein
MPGWIKDLLGQGISSLVAAAIPSATNPKIFQLPFINPQVPADLWLVTAVLTFVASFLTYGLAKPPSGAPAGTPPSPASRVSVFLAAGGFIFALLALITLLFITQRLATIDPGWESFLIRAAYLLFFVGMGPPLGWGLGRAIG